MSRQQITPLKFDQLERVPGAKKKTMREVHRVEKSQIGKKSPIIETTFHLNWPTKKYIGLASVLRGVCVCVPIHQRWQSASNDAVEGVECRGRQ